MLTLRIFGVWLLLVLLLLALRGADALCEKAIHAVEQWAASKRGE